MSGCPAPKSGRCGERDPVPQETGPLNLAAGEGVWDREPRLDGVPRLLVIVIVTVTAVATLRCRARPTDIILLNPHNSPMS